MQVVFVIKLDYVQLILSSIAIPCLFIAHRMIL